MVKRKEPEEPVVEARSETYVVSGPHGVYDAKPGEEISLDPDVPETLRLLARGQIAVAPPRQQSSGAASTEAESA